MESTITIQNANIDFSDYYMSKGISNSVKAKMENIDILAVPAAYGNHEFFFAQETINFVKYCRSVSSDYTFDVLAEDDIQVRSLHSFDIWMPVIWVASSVLLPFAINMVSNYIWEKLKGRENEPAQVDVTFLSKHGDKEKYIHYSGDARTFKENFDKIDLNKMWEDDA